MHFAVVEQVVGQAEIRQRDEHKEPATLLWKKQRFLAQQREAQEQRKSDQKPQSGSRQRWHAFHRNLDPQPRRAPTQANDHKQRAGEQSCEPGFADIHRCADSGRHVACSERWN
ncbi:hypothetical protein D3C81_1478180 [compost metagenome]